MRKTSIIFAQSRSLSNDNHSHRANLLQLRFGDFGCIGNRRSVVLANLLQLQKGDRHNPRYAVSISPTPASGTGVIL